MPIGRIGPSQTCAWRDDLLPLGRGRPRLPVCTAIRTAHLRQPRRPIPDAGASTYRASVGSRSGADLLVSRGRKDRKSVPSLAPANTGLLHLEEAQRLTHAVRAWRSSLPVRGSHRPLLVSITR